jgi:hypothetical protein
VNAIGLGALQQRVKILSHDGGSKSVLQVRKSSLKGYYQ